MHEVFHPRPRLQVPRWDRGVHQMVRGEVLEGLEAALRPRLRFETEATSLICGIYIPTFFRVFGRMTFRKTDLWENWPFGRMTDNHVQVDCSPAPCMHGFIFIFRFYDILSCVLYADNKLFQFNSIVEWYFRVDSKRALHFSHQPSSPQSYTWKLMSSDSSGYCCCDSRNGRVML